MTEMHEALGIVQVVVAALEFIFPVYCANAIPVIACGGYPLDFGREFLDGKRIFGANKTIRGFVAGLLVGAGVGLVESFLFGFPLLFGVVVSLGALIGDLCGAFLKRRLGIVPGGLLPVIDQVDFVLGAVLFAVPLGLSFMSWGLVIAVLVITPPVHLLTNFLAYKLGLKKNPW
jgi:CDP-2,3-bis-(O-geranylgeranyl)-sn-glycerol synthase